MSCHRDKEEEERGGGREEWGGGQIKIGVFLGPGELREAGSLGCSRQTTQEDF